MNPRRSGPLLLLLLITLGNLACGGARTPSESAPVVVHSEDRGSTVSIQRGERLVLLLRLPSSSARTGTWTLTTYPRPALTLVSADAQQGRFEFEARAVGSGKVVAAVRQKAARCVNPSATACHVPGGPGLLPPRTGSFILHVRVIA